MKITSEEELWEILGSLDKFNNFLDVYAETLMRKIMLAVPALVIHHIKNEHKYEKIRGDFFIKNPELVQHKEVLARQLNVTAAEHPDWLIEKVFTDAGIEAKKTIKKLLENKKE